MYYDYPLRLKRKRDRGYTALQNLDYIDTDIGYWIANLLGIEWEQFVLLVNEKEEPGEHYYYFLFDQNMIPKAEEFPLESLSRVMKRYMDIGFTKTAIRQVQS